MELSADRSEFARCCALEIQKAAKLSGGRLQDVDFVREMAFDMASSPALSRVPHGRVSELFAVARAHYAETPVLRHLVKAWEHHMRPQADAPAPKDAPRLPPPAELPHSEAQMRHLAAVRTSIACGGHMAVMSMARCATAAQAVELQAEEWMLTLLELNPSRGEVEAVAKASTDSSLAFYARCPDLPPYWGRWMLHYGIGVAKAQEED